MGTDYKAGGIKSNLTEGSRILYRHDGRDFKDDGKRTDSITADCRSSPVSGLRLGINEKGFALLMNVAPFTVRLWTSGASQPSGTALRLMQIFETAPEIVSKIAGESKSQMLGRNRRKRDISKG